jgi:hypothetical protein
MEKLRSQNRKFNIDHTFSRTQLLFPLTKLVSLQPERIKAQVLQYFYKLSTMPIESTLTRELEIRFIDARAIATEAKLNLGIEGYPGCDQEDLLIGEAIAIFHSRPGDVKNVMRRLKSDLEAVKKPTGINKAGSDTDDERTVDTSSDAFTVDEAKQSRKFKLWPILRRR